MVLCEKEETSFEMSEKFETVLTLYSALPFSNRPLAVSIYPFRSSQKHNDAL